VPAASVATWAVTQVPSCAPCEPLKFGDSFQPGTERLGGHLRLNGPRPDRLGQSSNRHDVAWVWLFGSEALAAGR